MNSYLKAGTLAVSLLGAAIAMTACGSSGNAPRQEMGNMQRPSSVDESRSAASTTTPPAESAARTESVRSAQADTSMPRASSEQSASTSATTNMTGARDEPAPPRQSRG